MFDQEVFSKRLKDKRKELGFTQEKLSECCDIKQGTYSGYENGNATPNLATVALLAKELGVSIDWLCGNDDVSSDITPQQWFFFTMKLLANPPSVLYPRINPGINSDSNPDSQLPLITMARVNDKETDIKFLGADMGKFFAMYQQLEDTMKDVIDEKTYNGFLKVLFDGYKHLFTPGWSAKGSYSGIMEYDKRGGNHNG